ncbi:MAG: hypothetical protein MJ127_02645 [Mogibacterium sp.]|nr:hypothetical protein [Mogibacterium sp.]
MHKEKRMADGRWVMTEDELNGCATGFTENPYKDLPNWGKHEKVDDRDGKAAKKCAFCGAEELDEGFGGYGNGFSYASCRCRKCGGMTDFVTEDKNGRFFK